MSTPDSGPKATGKGDKCSESSKGPQEGQELQNESRMKSLFDSNIEQIINDRLDAHEKRRTTQFEKQNDQFKNIMTNIISNEVSKLSNLISKEKFLTIKLKVVPDETLEQESVTDMNDPEETPVRGGFSGPPQLTGEFEPNSTPEDIRIRFHNKGSKQFNDESRKKPPSDTRIKQIVHDQLDAVENRLVAQLEKQNDELKKIMADILIEISKLSNLMSKEVSQKIKLQLDPDETLESQLDSNTDTKGFKDQSEDIEEAGVAGAQASENLNIDAVQSNLDNIEKGLGELKDMFEKREVCLKKIQGGFGKVTAMFDEPLIHSDQSLSEDIIHPQPKEDDNNASGNKVVKNATALNIAENNSKILEDEKPNQNDVPSLNASPRKLCFLCNEDATIESCEKCRNKKSLPKEEIPGYCGEAHKNLHWDSGHENSCGKKASRLGWREIRGTKGTNNGLPYYVATKELGPEFKEDIFTKKPLFTFAKGPDTHDVFALRSEFPEINTHIRTKEFVTCVSCYEIMVYGILINDPLNGLRLNKCPSCGWPVHSSHGVGLQKPNKTALCQEEHKEECEILTKNKKMWDEVKHLEGLYFHLGILRVVLNEDVKNKLLKLPASPGPCLYHKSIHKFVKECCQPNQVSNEDLDKLIHIVMSNYLPSPAGYYSLRKKHTYTIYKGGPTGRILPHSCNPNCSIHVDPKTGVATFKPRRKISKGEMLTMNYMVDVFPLPIHKRVLSLRRYHIENCVCDKCKDGKDYTSAMKFKCQKGKKSRNRKCCDSKHLMPYRTKKKDGDTTISKEIQPSTSHKDQGSPSLDNLYIWQCCSKDEGLRITQNEVEEKVRIFLKKILGHLYTLCAGSYEDALVKFTQVVDVVKTLSNDGEIHMDSDHHCAMLSVRVLLGYFVIWQIRESFFSGKKNAFLDVTVYERINYLDEAIEMLNETEEGRSETYGTLLFYRTLLQMMILTIRLRQAKNKTKIQINLTEIVESLEKSWSMFISDNPYISPIERSRVMELFDFYADHFENEIRQHRQDLVKSPESIFETFRLKNSKGEETPSNDPWYLLGVNNNVIESNRGSLGFADKCVPIRGVYINGSPLQIQRLELRQRTNFIRGTFIRNLFDPAL